MVVFEAKPHVLPLTDDGHLATMSEVLLGAPSAALLLGEPLSLADAACTALIAIAGLIESHRR